MLPLGASSLIQSTLAGDTGRWRALLRAPRLDALVRRRDGEVVTLEHYHRSQGRPDRGWDRGATLTSASTAPAALAQLPDAPWWRRGALIALVPESGAITEWQHDPAGEPLDWRATTTLGTGDQVGLISDGATLHAVIVRGGRARHWHRPAGGRWVGGADLGESTGAPALVAHRGVVSVALPRGAALVLLQGERGSWREIDTIPESTLAPALAHQPGGGLVLAAPQPDHGAGWWQVTPRGARAMVGPHPDLAPHARVHSLSLIPTALGGGVDATAVSLGAINLGGARQALGRPRGWLQALVAEDDSVYLWHRDQRRHDVRWVRAAGLRVLSAEPAPRAVHPSQKTAQISGEHDTQPSAGDPRRTLSRSDTASGVRGTDLGVRVEVAGSALMLFGDTHWSRKRWATRDAVATITDPDADLPGFEFHGAPLRFTGLGTTMTEYDVPLDAFCHGQRWYAFTSSNHFARHQVMGRSLLARAVDGPDAISGTSRRPFRFRTLAQISDLYFVNISCVPLPRDLPGLPFRRGHGDLIGLWGSGSYRADDLRFAVLDPSHDLADPQLAFFAGEDGGVPIWSGTEADAVPIVRGSYGEVSVRWVPELASYVSLSMSGPEDAAGGAVELRAAAQPWGPWSTRLSLFDWIADGLSFGDPTRRFIRAFVADDPVGDDIFGAQAGRPGGAYAPYFYDATARAEGVRLRYTLSTWNPYQVVLMEHQLTEADLLTLGVTRG